MEIAVVLLILALAALGWVVSVFFGVADIWQRRQKWVDVFEGEYLQAQKIEAMLEASGIPSEMVPSSRPHSAEVMLKVLSRNEEGARKLIRDSQD